MTMHHTVQIHLHLYHVFLKMTIVIAHTFPKFRTHQPSLSKTPLDISFATSYHLANRWKVWYEDGIKPQPTAWEGRHALGNSDFLKLHLFGALLTCSFAWAGWV